MIKANLKKNIIELAGNDMDYLSELMALTWELKERYPELCGLMKESFDTVMNAKERPIFESEEKFTRDMRELFGVANEPEEPAPLDSEDIEHLLYKAEKAEDKGNLISVSWSGAYAGAEVAIMHGNFNASKKIDASFSFRLHSTGYSAQKYREEYNNCIAHLEKLAGEKCDN